MPAGVEDRNADVWEALLAVADLAGGHWPESARAAAVAAVADTEGKAPSIGVMLLCDIRTIFSIHGTDHLMTQRLLTDLWGMEESPWASLQRDGSGIDARGLAKRLAPYGITSCDIRDAGGKNRKGYYRAAFTDTWERYIPPDDEPQPPGGDRQDAPGHPGDSVGPSPHVSATSATSATSQVNGNEFRPHSDAGVPTDKPGNNGDARRLFSDDELGELGRCLSCEWHPDTQGHGPGCPDATST